MYVQKAVSLQKGYLASERERQMTTGGRAE